MPLLENAVALLSSRAGWKSPRRGEDGAYRFRLNGGLDFAVFRRTSVSLFYGRNL